MAVKLVIATQNNARTLIERQPLVSSTDATKNNDSLVCIATRQDPAKAAPRAALLHGRLISSSGQAGATDASVFRLGGAGLSRIARIVRSVLLFALLKISRSCLPAAKRTREGRVCKDDAWKLRVRTQRDVAASKWRQIGYIKFPLNRVPRLRVRASTYEILVDKFGSS